jgi:hypothetical protein
MLASHHRPRCLGQEKPDDTGEMGKQEGVI